VEPDFSDVNQQVRRASQNRVTDREKTIIGSQLAKQLENWDFTSRNTL
jgi:hypothetical protein